jgi:hypothetical protein
MTQERLDQILKTAFDFGAQQKPGELSGLLQFLESKDLTNFLEIGTNEGGTFSALCQVIKGKKIALDAWYGLCEPERITNPIGFNQRCDRINGFSPDVIIVEGSSHEDSTRDMVRRVLDGQFLDFLLIDGDHRYIGASQDYKRYKDFVRPGGYIAFHDINDTEFARAHGCFVGQFWNELQGEKIEFNEHHNVMGIGVIQR